MSVGVNNGTWLYYDVDQDMAYDTLDPVGDIVLDANHALMLPNEVARRGISVWSPEPKPEPPKDDDDDDIKDDDKPQDDETVSTLERSGEPRRALVELMTSAEDLGWTSLRLLSMNWTGEDGDAAQSMAHLRTLMGQMAGGDAHVDCNLTCQFGDDGVLSTQYQGEYSRYQSMAGTLEAQASQADSAFAELTLTLRFEGGLAINAPEISDLREAFDLVSLGHTTFTAERHDGGT